MTRFSSLAALLALASACAPAARAPGALPDDWVNPQSAETAAFQDEASDADAAAQASLDSLVQAGADALPDPDGENAPFASLSPAASPGWGLRALMIDLSVTLQGALGLLMKGTAAVTWVWKRTPAALPPDAVLGLDPAAPLSEVSENAWAYAQAAAPELDSALAREALMETVAQTHAWARELSLRQAGLQGGGSRWVPSRLRLELSIDASGKPTPATTLGADARVRLEWKITPAAPKAAPAPSPVAELARDLAEDLESADAELSAHPAFSPASFRVGVGVSASGSVGVAKGGASAIAHLYFNRVATKPPHAVTHDLRGKRAGTAGKLRKGLRKAAKIARFFSKGLEKGGRGTWQVSEIKTGFDLSLGGELTLATVNGLAMAELTYKRN